MSKEMLIALGALLLSAGFVIVMNYQSDIRALRDRVKTGSQVIETTCGPIEYATIGEGPAVLMVHGVSGGYDQGLWIAQEDLGRGFHSIAPSRFGYLRTPLPEDASPAAQADAHACLLDALNISEVAIVGVSAGAPSSLQFALRYPERASALVLIVPAAYTPQPPPDVQSPTLPFLLSVILKSDLPLWAAMKVYPSSVLSLMGVPPSVQARLTNEEKEKLMRRLLPFGQRIKGTVNDGKVIAALDRYPLENITIPTLVMSAADDLWKTLDASQYTAENIPDAKFIGFESGGHMLIGQEEKVRAEVTAFLKQHARQQSSKGE